MRRIEGARVNGPYEHGNKWRCVVIGADGSRGRRTFETRGEAETYAATFRNAAQATTMKAAADAYVARVKSRGRVDATIESYEQRLALILNLKQTGAKPLRWIMFRGDELYARISNAKAADTHRNALTAGRSWGAFCVKQRWLKANPFADVEPVGRKRRGADKPQLRLDEARRFDEYCCQHMDNPAAVLALLALILGTRVSELVKRDVRDLDDDGYLLWIDATKTEAGRRRLELPRYLRDALVKLTAGRIGAAPIWVGPDGKRRTRHWALYQTRKLYKAAKVPVLDIHALRRSHATFANDAGQVGAVIAAQMGHESAHITRQAYINPDSTRAAAVGRAFRVLQGGGGNDAGNDVARRNPKAT